MVRTTNRHDFSEREVEACRRVLMELMTIFDEFKEHMVLVGGWVPYFLIAQEKQAHIGTLDVDLCFDFEQIGSDTYKTLETILLENQYYQDEKRSVFQWYRDITVDSEAPITVEVDLLAGEYGGNGKRHNNQDVQDVKARKARGSDLIFDELERFEIVALEGISASGARDTVSIRFAGVVPFLVMKGMALAGRNKMKDAYDIVYVIENYAGGVEAIINLFRPDLANNLVKEGLGKIRNCFESIEHKGPIDYVSFLGIDEQEERELMKQRAYLLVVELLDALAIEKFIDKKQTKSEI